MTIGKFCQLCGAAQKPGEIIAEAHGVVVNVDCLLGRVYGDQPLSPEAVEAEVRFCRRCGAQLPEARPSHCPRCGAPVLARDGEADLAKLGRPAPLEPRLAAFLIDLLPVGLLAALGVWAGLRAMAALFPEEVAAVSDWEPWAVSVSLTFILYHTVLTAVFGRTLGKAMLGLRAALKDGTTGVGWGRSFIRSCLYLLTLYVAPLGVILLMIYEKDSARRKSIIEDDALFHNQITGAAVIKT